MTRNARYTFWMVGLLLLVMWLGGRKLNADGVWFDEWWSLYVAGADVFELPRTIPEIWARIRSDDIRQGVLYPMLLAGWSGLTGWSVYATRALSLFAGLIALAAVYRLGSLVGRRAAVGFGAAAVLGTSIWFIHFLHEMRVYMLMVMLVALLLLLYQRIMMARREPPLLAYTALALVTGLLLNTHYFASLFVGVIGLWHVSQLFRARTGQRWWRTLYVWGVSAVMVIPVVINLPLATEVARSEPRTQPDLILLAEIFSDTFSAFSNTHLALLGLLCVFSLVARPAWRIWLWIAALFSLNLVAYYIFSLNELRYNMALLPLLALVAGFGIDELKKRRVSPVIILGLWLVGLWMVEGDFRVERMIQRWPAQPIREMAEVLRPHVREDDVIMNLLGNDNRPTLALHPLVHYMGDFGARIEVIENITHPGTATFAARVREASHDADRVWLLYDPRWESAEWALTEFLLNEQGYHHCGSLVDSDRMRIWAFGRSSEAAAGGQFGDGLRLQIDEPTPRDGVLPVWVFYQFEDDFPANNYSTALHLRDESGQVRGQSDAGLAVNSPACQLLEIPVGDLPPGDYQLHAAVYNWQTGKRLAASAVDDSDNDYPLLATITLQG